jgi:hypothetical protein
VRACEHGNKLLGLRKTELYGQLMIKQPSCSNTLFYRVSYFVKDGQSNINETFYLVLWLNFVFITNSVSIRMQL